MTFIKKKFAFTENNEGGHPSNLLILSNFTLVTSMKFEWIFFRIPTTRNHANQMNSSRMSDI